MLQQIAWQVTLIFVFIVILVFGFVVLRSGQKADYDPIVVKAYRVRKYFFIALLVLLIPTLIMTLAKTPFSVAATSVKDPQIVKVTGYQFYWKLSTDQVKAGQPVEFDVTSADVNHGFGIYDENMQIVAQTQAMPGYTNKLFYTFLKPGTYQILCLEYCSVGHHAMIGKITVTGNGGVAYGKPSQAH